MDPAHYSHPGAILAKDENYQGVLIFQVSLHDKNILGTITKCVDCAGVLNALINMFQDISKLFN